MSFIIGKSCVDCMDTACANACPVDCIHGPINIEGSGSEVGEQGKDAFPGGQLYITLTLVSIVEHVFLSVPLVLSMKMKI